MYSTLTKYSTNFYENLCSESKIYWVFEKTGADTHGKFILDCTWESLIGFVVILKALFHTVGMNSGRRPEVLRKSVF